MYGAMLGLVLGLAQPAGAEPMLPPRAPVEVLPLEITIEGLGGAGGERLRGELSDVQFVAVGEDHGFAEPPRLAAALGQELARTKGAPVQHAVEVGPHGTRHVASVLRGPGLAGLDAIVDDQPSVMPFLSNLDDAALALPYARTGRLWGIDQEFIGSGPMLYALLAARTRDAELRRTLGTWRDADRAALAAGQFNKVSLSTLTPADFARLRQGFSRDPEALRMIEALAESARIYQYNEAERYFENNDERRRLMAAYFLARYRATKGPPPRVLFKMGAYHLGRGITPTSVFDLGSLLPGLAAAEGKRSLHIAVVPVAGQVRTIAPGPQGLTKVSAYDEDSVAKLLAGAGIELDRLPAQGLALIPLEPIRQRMSGKTRRELPEFARFMLLGFDYLVTTRDAHAATHFEAWEPGMESKLVL
ncbi:MAG: hypothetical protein ACK564_02570 [Novosphingobium sp.]|uniref:hypothetical protein n=1 Tax=Novosphingobium sp. TaxID=1874826 RepID=UPI00391C2D14|nr:hypothetical protein [Novosphingobium sp.]